MDAGSLHILAPARNSSGKKKSDYSPEFRDSPEFISNAESVITREHQSTAYKVRPPSFFATMLHPSCLGKHSLLIRSKNCQRHLCRLLLCICVRTVVSTRATGRAWFSRFAVSSSSACQAGSAFPCRGPNMLLCESFSPSNSNSSLRLEAIETE